MTDGRFAVERTIGRGGMATVYLAHDRVLDRSVALKVLAPHLAGDEGYRGRFLREARLAARLLHPNVVQVYDVGEDDRGPYIVMELVEGPTLAEELRMHGPFPSSRVADIGIQICSALEAAHGAGLVHRDIKPHNVLLCPGGQVKVADFGIARSLAGTQHTAVGTVLGTAPYLAPEQARGAEVTAAADIYSCGVVLYELLAGRRPFEAETLAQLAAQYEQGVATPPGELAAGVPPPLEDTVMRCLALSPAYRPASASVLAAELAAAVPEPPTVPLPQPSGIVARDVPATVAAYRARPRRRAALIALAAVLGLIAGAAGLALGRSSETAAKPPVVHRTRSSTTRTATQVAIRTVSRTPVTSCRAVDPARPPHKKGARGHAAKHPPDHAEHKGCR